MVPLLQRLGTRCGSAAAEVRQPPPHVVYRLTYSLPLATGSALAGRCRPARSFQLGKHTGSRGEGLPDDTVLRFQVTTEILSRHGRQRLATQQAAAEMTVFRQTQATEETTPLLPTRVRPTEQQEGGPPTPPASPNSWQYLVLMATLGIVICYADRSNMSTAVLPMAQAFGWDKAYQGFVLSSFFIGYATTQVLGGQLADKLGGKMVLAAGVALWSLFTFATPAAAAAGTTTLIAARVLLGVGEGVAFPAIHSLIARNVPTDSRTTAVGVITAASYAGTALAFGVSPWLISMFGWEWVFYSFAAMALLWLPLWLPVQTRNLPFASQLDSQPDASAFSQSAYPSEPSSSQSNSAPVITNSTHGSSSVPTGLAGLIRRREVWAICLAQYTQSWGMYGLLTWLPTFFSEYYQVELANLGAYTLLPYVVQGGIGMFAGVLADRLISAGWPTRTVRVVLQVLGMLGPAACLLLAVSPVVGNSPALASSIITVGLGLSALTLGGVSASHLDIAPRHAGVVFGAGNTAATLAGFLAVPATGFILQATGSWPLVFSVTAAHYVVGALMWALWCGDKVLPEDSEPATAPAALS